MLLLLYAGKQEVLWKHRRFAIVGSPPAALQISWCPPSSQGYIYA